MLQLVAGWEPGICELRSGQNEAVLPTAVGLQYL